jgi:hypothetical protein
MEAPLHATRLLVDPARPDDDGKASGPGGGGGGDGGDYHDEF